MQLDQLPTTTRITDEDTGQEQDIAVALLLMNEPEDDGRTTGWYWSAIPRERSQVLLQGKKLWKDAVDQHQGPFEDAGAAIRGAGDWSPLRHAVALLLRQAASLVLSGQTAPDAAAIAKWIDGHEWVEKARQGEKVPMAHGAEAGAVAAAADNTELLKTLSEGDIPDRPGVDVDDDDEDW